MTTTELHLHGRKIDTVFQLLGENENDITYSVAWAMSQSPHFLRYFLRSILKRESKIIQDVSIRLQHIEKSGGITDIEIESPGNFFIIIEAKRGWDLPSRKQLQLYANRSSFKSNDASIKRIVILSECSQEYANLYLECREINGVPVIPASWKDIVRITTIARSGASNTEKHIIDELQIYLRGLMTMQNIYTNRVYVVSIKAEKEEGWGISWIDIVEKRKRYFHPVGLLGFPPEPVNYIAFRYGGRLQSIHHVEGYEIFNNPHDKFPEIPNSKWDPHFLYKLSPAFGPDKIVKTGKIYRSGRVWCMLDTLFTSNTISDARDKSKKREEQAE